MKCRIFHTFFVCALLCLPTQSVFATSENSEACVEGLIPGCDGVCGSGKDFDDCGVCDGGNADKDDCQVCFGDNRDKDSCGVCFGGDRDKDDCGICFGDGSDKGCDGVCFSNASVDVCGTCGGPGQTGCDQQCGSTLQLDECGVCGGDGSSCACSFYGINNNPVYTNGATVLSGPPTSLGCVQDILANCGSDNIARANYAPDDCVAFDLHNGQGAFWNEPEVQRNGAAWFSTYMSDMGFYYDQTWIIDANCQRVDSPPTALCGTLNLTWSVSPISLVLDDNIDINQVQAVTQFDLNPSESGKYYPWRASSETPLLVWDPGKTGEITSAAQLFGNWTFGGKKSSYVPAALNGDSFRNATAWADGYEALGTLDSNGDGRVSGDELDGIALWYDHNMNGVSEAGEIKDIRSADVTSLYYKGGKKDPVGGNINLAHGFDMVKGSEVLQGKSVDWYSEGYDSAYEAITSMLIQQTSENGVEHLEDRVLEQPADRVSPGAVFDNDPVQGTWIWEWSEKSKLKTTGLLIFHLVDGKIGGASVLEVPLKKNSEKYRSAILWYNTLVEKDETNSYSFKIKDAQGATTISRFKVEKDRLVGLSTWTPAVKGAPVEYEWTAKRQFKK